MRKALTLTSAALLLAACSSEMGPVHQGNDASGYTAALELGSAHTLATTGFAAQPSVQGGSQLNSGFGFYVDRGYFGTQGTGLVFGPLALLMPGGAAIAPSTSATTFFMTIRLDPNAAPWMQPVITNTQLEYLAPPAFDSAF